MLVLLVWWDDWRVGDLTIMNIFGIRSELGVPVIDSLVSDFANKSHVNLINIAYEEWLKHRKIHEAIMFTYNHSGCTIFTRDDWRGWKE